MILNPLHAKLNPICHLLALLGGHHIIHVSRIRVKTLLERLEMEYKESIVADFQEWV